MKGKRLNYLRYVDYVVIIAEKKYLKMMLLELDLRSEKTDLKKDGSCTRRRGIGTKF